MAFGHQNGGLDLSGLPTMQIVSRHTCAVCICGGDTCQSFTERVQVQKGESADGQRERNRDPRAFVMINYSLHLRN